MPVRTFNFTVQPAPVGDWPAAWLLANPLGTAAWNGRWTAGAVNMDADGPSGLYATFPDEEGNLSAVFNDGDGHHFDYDDAFLYDPLTGMHTVGGGVGTASSYGRAAELKTWYYRYDPRSNQWMKRNNPVGIGTGHHYSENAMDRVGRKYYRRFWQFDLDNWYAPPVLLPNPPGWGGGGTAQAKVFHEHLGRLYAISDDDRHWYWTPDVRDGTTGTWSAQQSHGYDLGLHPIGTYHIGMQTAIFGGGNAPSSAFFRITPTGAVQRIDDPPAQLLPVNAGSGPTMIIDCGLPDAFVVMFDKELTPPAPPFNTIWLLRPYAAPGSQWVQSVDALPPYLTSWSSFRASNATGLPHLGVVMYLRTRLSGTATDPDLMQRHSSVYFYKPSGN